MSRQEPEPGRDCGGSIAQELSNIPAALADQNLHAAILADAPTIDAETGTDYQNVSIGRDRQSRVAEVLVLVSVCNAADTIVRSGSEIGCARPIAQGGNSVPYIGFGQTKRRFGAVGQPVNGYREFCGAPLRGSGGRLP